MRPTGLAVTFFSASLTLTCAFGLAQTSGPKAAGEAVYKQHCATCHEQTNPRIPPRTALNQMPSTRILRALDFGAMMTVAYPMSRDEREASPRTLVQMLRQLPILPVRIAAIVTLRFPPSRRRRGTAGVPAATTPAINRPRPLG